ncbi:gliding motility protein GldM [bacterium]|nr:gliding motility protein GldM [bacterium]
MANVKLSPRQRMINMMYLVLIALLVLNVDKRILKSFHIMEKNILGSSYNLDEKNNLIMAGFSDNLKSEKEKTQPYYEKAQEAREITREFNQYIDQIKSDIEKLYGGRLDEENLSEEIAAMKSPELMEAHAHYFMVENQGKRAKELKERINATRDKLLALLQPGPDSLFTTTQSYDAVSRANQLEALEPERTGPKEETWASINLEYQPAGALMAMLSQLQFNAKSLESDVLTKLAEGIHMFDFKFDRIHAEVVPQSNYVMAGEPYQAKVMLVASNTSTNHKFLVNGEPWTEVENGAGSLNIPTSGVGNRDVEGYILVPNPRNNKMDSFYFEDQYQVFQPIATVALDKMNLFYTEVENPISVSVPGFSAADLNVSISSGGRLVPQGNGQYNVVVDGSARQVRVSVSANGRVMGTYDYRVRRVPEPQGKYGGLTLSGAPVPKAVAAAQTHILAFMGEDFAYELKFQVQSFDAYFFFKNKPPRHFDVRGGVIPNELRQLIARAAPGEKVLVDNIRAKDTRYGIVKKLPGSLFFTLN